LLHAGERLREGERHSRCAWSPQKNTLEWHFRHFDKPFKQQKTDWDFRRAGEQPTTIRLQDLFILNLINCCCWTISTFI